MKKPAKPVPGARKMTMKEYEASAGDKKADNAALKKINKKREKVK